MIERKLRYHDDPHHKSNWCTVCGLYYCWHPEVKDHRNDGRAYHKFIPNNIGYNNWKEFAWFLRDKMRGRKDDF